MHPPTQSEQELRRIVAEVLPLLTPDAISSIVTHLRSDLVGVASMNDLTEITANDLAGFNLTPISVRKLLKVFHSNSSLNKESGKCIRMASPMFTLSPSLPS